MSNKNSSPAELDRSIAEMQKRHDELYANPVEEECSARANTNFLSPRPALFHFSALQNKGQMVRYCDYLSTVIFI